MSKGISADLYGTLSSSHTSDAARPRLRMTLTQRRGLPKARPGRNTTRCTSEICETALDTPPTLSVSWPGCGTNLLDLNSRAILAKATGAAVQSSLSRH